MNIQNGQYNSMEQSRIIDTLETYHRTAGHGRQEQAARLTLVWVAGARRTEVEEALRPLDGHHTVTRARIVYID